VRRKAHIILQNLQAAGEAPEMIVVFVNSEVNREESTRGMSRKERIKVYDKTGEDLIYSLMPHINRHYSVYQDKKHTALAGNSMGGREALYTAFTNQGKFDYVGAFSSANIIDIPGCEDDVPLDDFLASAYRIKDYI
ncbi:MAG: alpha/beta hydrolase-fold protein, partial [Bacillota bacterium]|nr:alpha/beta hydrolase-fold protein [Bacillota bacterium]